MRNERFFTYVEKHPVVHVVAKVLNLFMWIYLAFTCVVVDNFSGEMLEIGKIVVVILFFIAVTGAAGAVVRKLIPDVYKGELVTDYFSIYYHAQSNWKTCKAEVKVNGRTIVGETAQTLDDNFLVKIIEKAWESERKFKYCLPDGNCIVLRFDRDNLNGVLIVLNTTIIVKDGKIRYDFIDQIYEATNNQSTVQTVQQSVNETPSQIPVNESIGRTAPIAGFQSANSYTLVALEGQFAGRKWNLDKSVMLGRDGNCCQVIFAADTAGVSRVHCEVGYRDGSLYIRDLGSSYGTVLENGSIVNNYQEVKVENNTVFRLNNNEKFMLTK